jgi:hypothetical protein
VEKKLPFKKGGPVKKKKKPEEAAAPGAPEEPKDQAALAAAPETAAPAAGGEGTTGPAKKGKAVSATKAKAKKETAAPKKEKKARPPARVPQGRIPFICSECYEEFFLPATYSRDTVTCPDCLHVGKRPADDFLRKVTLHKGEEKKAFSLALVLSEALAVVTAIFLWSISPFQMPQLLQDNRANVQMGSGILAALLILGLILAAAKYEKNRWEVYF